MLFIVVVGFFPAGFAGLGFLVNRWRKKKPPPEAASIPDPDSEPETVGAQS
jgi:urea transport system permease protein